MIGIEQMKKLPRRAERKKTLYRLYQELLASVPGVEFLPTDLHDTAPWFMDILVEPEARDPLAHHMKEQGVGTRPFYPATHTQAPFAHVDGQFPAAVACSRRGLWLPSSPRLADDEVGYVCQAISDYFASS